MFLLTFTVVAGLQFSYSDSFSPSVNATTIPSTSAPTVASSTDQKSGNPTICQSQRQIALQLKNANKTYDFVPNCHENGSFVKEQELSDGWRFCIDKKGVRVHGSMRSPHLPKMTCAEYERYAKQRDVEDQKMLKAKKTSGEKKSSSVSKTATATVKAGNASSSEITDAAGAANVTSSTLKVTSKSDKSIGEKVV